MGNYKPPMKPPVKKKVAKPRAKKKPVKKTARQLETERRHKNCLKVIGLVNSGLAVRNAVGDVGISSLTFYKWIEESEENKKLYAHATDERARAIFEDMLDIADDVTNDTKTITGKSGQEMDIEDKEWTSRSKLRIETRKWMLGKMKPKKYGDKIDVTTDGEKIKPVDLSSIVGGFMGAKKED